MIRYTCTCRINQYAEIHFIQLHVSTNNTHSKKVWTLVGSRSSSILVRYALVSIPTANMSSLCCLSLSVCGTVVRSLCLQISLVSTYFDKNFLSNLVISPWRRAILDASACWIENDTWIFVENTITFENIWLYYLFTWVKQVLTYLAGHIKLIEGL